MLMNKVDYEPPLIEIITLSDQEIITTSNFGNMDQAGVLGEENIF